MLRLSNSLVVFNDLEGNPLDGGYIYIGTAGQNPETNPINCYWDIAGTLPAAQPIRTTNGYPARNGTPSAVYISADYSLTVRDSRSRLVITTSSTTSIAASGVEYDNATSGSLETDVQGVIDEMYGNQDDFATLSGVSKGSTTLGTFDETIIPDNSDIKEALQALETHITDSVDNGIRKAATTGGTANAITATFSPVNSALADGMLHLIVPTLTNTSQTVTYAPDGLTAYNVKKMDGNDLLISDIAANMPLILRYRATATEWRCVNTVSSKVYRVCAGLTADVDISGGPIAIDWDYHSYTDLASLHSTSSNPSRFVVPSGATRFRIKCVASTGPTPAQTVTIQLYKNGSASWIGGAKRAFQGNGAVTVLEFDSGWLSCTAADYFQLYIDGVAAQYLRGNSGADSDESYVVFEVI